MSMSGPQRISAEAFAVDLLREDPNLDYAAIRERARSDGISVQPIHYGRARKQLGLPALRDVRPTMRASQDPVASEPATTLFEPVDEPAEDQPETTPPEEPLPPVAADTGLVAPRRKGSPAFDYLVQLLRNEPNAIYADLRDRCATKGFKIAPIMYGRAKAVLGLVPVRPRGKKALAAPIAPTGVPMQLKQVDSVAADRFTRQLDEVRSLEQLISAVKDLDAERRRLRGALERAIALLDEALGP
jgi:hypothetical protein